MKKLAALTLSLFVSVGIAFADTPKDTPKAAGAQPAKSAAAAKPKATKTAEKSDSAIAAEIEELRQALQAQQEQFHQALQSQQEQLTLLKEELAKRDRQIDEERDAAAAANSRAAEASSKATEAVNTSVAMKSTADMLNTTVANLSASNAVLKSAVETTKQADAKKADEEGPASIRYKGITLTPSGFIAAETVTRSHATSSDIFTPFTGIPFAAADLAHVAETNFSSRATRVGLLAQGKVGSVNVSGYYEGDFLGTGVTSNNRQNNSYLFRQRQLYAQAAFDNGFIVTAGAQWTMATENKKGILNRQEDLTLNIDANQNVGFGWERQWGFRVVKDFGGKFALGFSLEEPQATIGGRGFSSVTTINSGAAPATIVTTGTTTSITGNFFLTAPGNPAGAYNPFDSTGYTVNKAPDFIFKAAADPGFGHYELFGIVSLYRDRIYPCGVVGTNAKDTAPPAPTIALTGACLSATPTVVSSFGATNTGVTGGGVGASALWPLFHKKVDFGLRAVAGDGIGRYGAAQLADATARPDGTLALIRNAQAFARLEWHVTPKLDVFAYWGAEYGWRAGYSGYDTITITKTAPIPATPTSTAIPGTTTTVISTTGIGGYGNRAANNTGCATEGVTLNDFNPSSGANCAGDIRMIQEPTIGFWYKFFQSTKGRLQFGMQYSYLTRDSWSGIGGVPSIGGAAPIAISPKAIDNMVFTSFRYYLP
jgi:hypothetical protein